MKLPMKPFSQAARCDVGSLTPTQRHLNLNNWSAAPAFISLPMNANRRAYLRAIRWRSATAADRDLWAAWRDVLAEGVACGLHKIERLMRAQALRARPRRRGLPKDEGDRLVAALSPNLLDRQFVA